MNAKRILVSIALVLVPLAIPYLALAAHAPIKTNVFNPTTLDGPLLVCVGGVPQGNPTNNTLPVCQDLCDFVAQVSNIIYYAIAVVLWIITPILIMVAGVRLMISRGNPEAIGSAKKTITSSVWAIVLVLCAWLIVYSIVGAFGNLSKYVGGFGGANGQAACSI